MRFKFLSVLAAGFLLAACASTPEDTQASSAGGSTTSGAAGTVASTVVPGSQEDLVQNVGDRVFFGFDRYDLTPEAQATLERQAAWLQQYPAVTVSVEGHADERGTREYNLALGERRANSVKNYLVALGIDQNRVATISYGKERPAVPGSNEDAWAQNRRAVTVVTGGAPAS
ncbi:MAG: peptidoglycan-associated lipoprotein Pal [Rhodospirillales bacterium]|nr:peptidoglycan-associated lipoprotein Pal [Rhodospirillales bacterium]